jgi:hypothetical protein
MPGGHVGNYNVGGVEGEVAVGVGGLDVVSVGVAEHTVHGGFDVECLTKNVRKRFANSEKKKGKGKEGWWGKTG